MSLVPEQNPMIPAALSGTGARHLQGGGVYGFRMSRQPRRITRQGIASGRRPVK